MIGRVGLVSSSDAKGGKYAAITGAVFSGFRDSFPVGMTQSTRLETVVFPLSWEWCGSPCTRWPRQAASSDTPRNPLRPLCISALHRRRLLCLVHRDRLIHKSLSAILGEPPAESSSSPAPSFRRLARRRMHGLEPVYGRARKSCVRTM